MHVSVAAKIAAAAEPDINRSYGDLDVTFHAKLQVVFIRLLREHNLHFKFHEGFRTVERQQWLYGQGRKSVAYARPGPIVTQRDGVRRLSNHQGTGKPGTGMAADCYPLDARGRVILEPAEAVWEAYASVAESVGLSAGYRWKAVDSPHVELIER